MDPDASDWCDEAALGRSFSLGCQVETLEGLGGVRAAGGVVPADSVLGLLEAGAEDGGDWDGVGTGDGFPFPLVGAVSPTSEV